MKTQEQQAKQIAGLVGPSVMVIVAAEFPLIQPHLYDQQTLVGVYLSGVLLFIAGLAIVRAHHHWRANWTVLVTLTGWVGLLLGLVRMFAASAYRNTTAGVGNGFWMVLEVMLFLIGSAMTYHAYRQSGES